MAVVPLLLILVWLAVCAVWDLRHRELPLWITLVPYLAGAAYAALRGQWPAALLAVLLIPVSDLPKVLRLAGSILLVAAAEFLSPNTDGIWLSAAVWLVWLIWDWFPALYGGADARILIALALLALDGRIVLVLLLGMGLVGLILKAWKGRPTPMVPGILVGGIVYLMLFHNLRLSLF
jgi:prepilin signal peptidase PulO-like enzyme (type II secretory pathway)